jgi:hypothetical protein
MGEKPKEIEAPTKPLSSWDPLSAMLRRNEQQWLRSLPDEATHSWARKVTSEDTDATVDDDYILIPNPHQKPKKKSVTEGVMDTTKSKALKKKKVKEEGERN